MKRRTYLHAMTAALLGAALVAGLAAPSAAQFGGRTRGSRTSSNRGGFGATARPTTTRPTTQTAATDLTPAHYDWGWYDASVVQQNIFAKQRGRSGGFVRPPSTQPYQPSAATWVLCGIVLEATERVGFLENERTGATIRVHAGDNVGGATVVQVEEDYLKIESRGAARTIAIGKQLSGEAGGLARSTPAFPGVPGAPGVTGSGSEPAPAAGNGDAGPEAGPGGSIFVDEGAPADGAPGMADQGGPGGDQAAEPPLDNGEGDAGAPAAPLSPQEEMLQKLRARRAAELNK